MCGADHFEIFNISMISTFLGHGPIDTQTNVRPIGNCWTFLKVKNSSAEKQGLNPPFDWLDVMHISTDLQFATDSQLATIKLTTSSCSVVYIERDPFILIPGYKRIRILLALPNIFSA